MRGVLVTPACDVEQEKAPFWTFVALFTDEELAAQIGRDSIGNLVKQKLPRYHWFPPLTGVLPALVADFTVVSSIPISEAVGKKRLASLVSSWKEQLPSRYVAYMGRIGTEDLPDAELKASIERLKKKV